MIAVLPSSSFVMSASLGSAPSTGALTSWVGAAGAFSTSGCALAPEVAPAVVLLDLHAALPQHVEARGIAIRLPVIDAGDVGVDDHLGAHNARRCAHEHHLPRELRSRLDECVLL